MIDIYEFKDEDNNEKHVASKEYVDILVKQLTDLVLNHINEHNAHQDIIDKKEYIAPNIDIEYAKLPNNESQMNKINPETIFTDSNHRFVSEQEMMSIKRRPTALEMNTKINDVRNQLEEYINNKFDTMLNSTNSLNKIKSIITMIDNDDLGDKLDNLFNKLNESILNHENDGLHLKNEDRNALNVLIEVIKNGFADWNAEEGAINSIANKPDLEDYRDADTLNGYTACELFNKRTFDLIIGSDIEDKSSDLILHDDKSYDYFYDMYNNSNIDIYFKQGEYVFGNTLTIGGKISGLKNSVLVGDFDIKSDSIIRDIKFYDSIITLHDNTLIENCEFEKCDIVFDSSRCVRINSNKFNICNFINIGYYIGLIITYNILIKTQLIILGKDNVVENNITL